MLVRVRDVLNESSMIDHGGRLIDSDCAAEYLRSPKAHGYLDMSPATRQACRLMGLLWCFAASACDTNGLSSASNQADTKTSYAERSSGCSTVESTVMAKSSGKSADDVRVFHFVDTVVYIPTEWLGKLSDENGVNDGRFVPDVLRVECPGIVHQVTNGLDNSLRYVDIGISIAGDGLNAALGIPATGLQLQKLRRGSGGEQSYPDGDFVKDGFLASKDHKRLDAYVRVRPDVGVRLLWRPTVLERTVDITDPKSPERPVQAISEYIDSTEWKQAAAGVRRLFEWLATPPNERVSDPRLLSKGEAK